MTDKSLENFFAKKDKSKKSKSKSKSSKAKFTTSDQIAKSLTDGDGEKKEKKEKKQPVLLTTTTDEVGENNGSKSTHDIPQADDEWKDFDDPSSKDYSGLRIQSLQISTVEPEDERDQEGEEFDENGDLKSNNTTSGPWHKAKSTETQLLAEVEVTPVSEPTPQPPVAVVPEAPKSNRYVPPAKRAGGVAESMPTSLTPANDRIRRKKKLTAPEISSESDFPSLSASSDLVKYRTKENERDFETVTKGGRSDEATLKSSQIEVQNKYAALQQN